MMTGKIRSTLLALITIGECIFTTAHIVALSPARFVGGALVNDLMYRIKKTTVIVIAIY